MDLSKETNNIYNFWMTFIDGSFSDNLTVIETMPDIAVYQVDHINQTVYAVALTNLIDDLSRDKVIIAGYDLVYGPKETKYVAR